MLLLLVFLMQTQFKPVFAAPKGAQGPPAVMVQKIEQRPVNPPREYVGHVQAVQDVDIQARVDGYLEQVHFKEGSLVQKGDLLYTIDQSTYRAQVQADKARVAKAEAVLKQAAQYLDRVQNVQTGGVSEFDRDSALAEKLEAEASLDQAKAALENSMIDLGFTTINAPIKGKIGKTRYNQGDLVGVSSGIMATIIQIDPIRVVFSVSESDLSKVQKAIYSPQKDNNEFGRFNLLLPGGEKYPHNGKIAFTDNKVDSDTGTIAVYLQFDNPEKTLVPGEYVTVQVQAEKPEQRPVVPQAAVMQDQQGRFVFVLTPENKVEKRQLTTGAALDTVWVVREGLKAGETIIVSGIQKVRPGQKVKPTSKQK
jgi:membrane fusion protein (multidrug efflux system)